MTRLTWCAPFVVSLALPLPAESQQMRPISEIMRSDDVADIAYAARRCAALYWNFQVLWQEDQPDLAATFEESKESFFLMAHSLAQEGQTREIPVETTFQEIADIAQVYRKRADENRAVTGDYFSQDPLVLEDGTVCRAILDAVPS